MATSLEAFAFVLALAPQTAEVVKDESILGRPPSRDRRRVPPPASRGFSVRGRSLVPPSPPDGDDVQVNAVNADDQNETAIAFDPTDRLHLVAGFNDDRAGNHGCTFCSSFDGGSSWGELVFPIPSPFTMAGDPLVAIGLTGDTYLLALAYRYNSSIYVGPSPDGGVTVPTWFQAVKPTTTTFEDKPYMVVDRTGGSMSGAVYVTWTRFRNRGPFPIFMTASFDGGQTWSAPKRLSDSGRTQGSSAAVGPNGELDVVFYDYGDYSIKFDTSPDGGLTWGTDVRISPCTFLPSVPNAIFRTNSFPSIAIDTSGGPYQGTIYVVWATDFNSGQGPDVLLSKSTDGGATWSAPVVASDVATRAQFSPGVAVDPNGNVDVGFYDRRLDANDTKIDYYVSRSSDGGNTFLPNVKVSDQAFDPNSYSQGGFIGDYTGICSSDRAIHPIWTDGRNGNNDVYTSRVQLDFSTDSATLSAAAGGTVNFRLDPGPLFQFDDYHILGSVSGTSPGITLRGVNVPVNYDTFMWLTIAMANTSALPGFSGTLDASGMATAALIAPPLPPSLVGVRMDFAMLVRANGAVRWASDATHLEIVP